MKQNDPVFTKDDKISAPVGLTLNCLLLTRFGDEKTATREAFKDEVDIYISSLMAAFADPARVGHLKPYLMEPDLDIFRRLEKASDARVKYIVYRTQDDALVTAVAFFGDGDADTRSKNPEYTNGKQGQMGRGDTYLRFAFTYTDVVADVKAAMGGVLKQLSTGFDKYITIVTYLLGEPYNLSKRFEDAEIYVLDSSTSSWMPTSSSRAPRT